MESDIEKAQLLFKLIRGKKNWGSCYDRLEHLKRFSKKSIEELVKTRWLIAFKKNFKAVSVNPQFKKEIIEFIERYLPHLKYACRNNNQASKQISFPISNAQFQQANCNRLLYPT